MGIGLEFCLVLQLEKQKKKITRKKCRKKILNAPYHCYCWKLVNKCILLSNIELKYKN